MTTEVHFKQIESKIIKHLNEAQNSVEIAVAWITSPNIIDSIDKCLKRRVSVRLLSVNDQINNIEKFAKLYYSGAKIKLISKKLMHNKFCLIDRSIIISGSYNWTTKAANNHENITITFNNHKLIETFTKEFEEIWYLGEEIRNLIPINKNDISKLENEFNSYLSDIKQNQSLPYIYYIKDSIILKSQYYKENHFGNIRKGYYLIRDENEQHDFFKYLFYSKSSFEFKKLKEIVSIPNQLKGCYIKDVLYSNLPDKDTFIEISKDTWVEYSFGDDSNRGPVLSKINSKGEFLNEKFGVHKKFRNSYLIYNKGKYQIFKPNGQHLDFNYLNFQEPTFGIYVGSFIDENHFLSDVLVDNEYKASKKAIFNVNGNMVSDPIFYSSEFRTVNGCALLEETPVLLMDKHLVISTLQDNIYKAISLTAIQNWRFYNKVLSKDGIAKITHKDFLHIYNSLYVSDLEFGPLYFTLSFLKTSWDLKYVEMAKLQYQKNNIKNLSLIHI
jgi:hypothetical protein